MIRSLKGVVLVLVGVVLFGSAVFAQQRTDAQILSDLQQRIRSAPQTGINVTASVQNSVVTLSGTTVTLAQRLNIVNIARRTVGVTDVVDRITVVPAERRSDQDITRGVRQSLAGNLSRDDLSALTIRVQGGVVFLSGTLSSSYPKQIAGVLASWVPGVVDVRNNIVVRPAQSVSDAAIQNAIEDKFHKNPFISTQKIQVFVGNGVVTLTGIVDNYLAAEQAESVARFVPGVVDVRNLIFVRAMGV